MNNINYFFKKYRIFVPNTNLNTVSGDYYITYQSGGDVTLPSTFTAYVLNDINQDLVITPSSLNNDGYFTPSSITLNNDNKSVNFTYTPLLWGDRQIQYANSNGFTNPTNHSFVAKIQTGFYGYNIPTGNITPSLGGFSMANASSLWFREFSRVISGEPLSPFSASHMNVIGSRKLNFTTGASWRGKNSNYTYPFCVVSGNTPFIELQTWLYDTIFNPSSVPFFQGMAQQVWPVNYDLLRIENGNTFVSGKTTSKFLHLYKSGDKVLFWNNGYGNPIFTDLNFYEVQSVVNNSGLILSSPYIGTNRTYGYITGPYNRNPDYTTINTPDSSDKHLLVYLRNEETGGADLYETYNTYTSGNVLRTSSSAYYEYNDTMSPRNHAGGTTAAGVPMAPILLNYDEAVNDRINHCIAVTATTYGGLIKQSCVWPAIAMAGGITGSGIPYGGRLRLNKSWYDSNINNYSSIVQNILKAFMKYGIMLIDGGNWLDILTTNDDRWLESDITAISNIPGSSFEVPLSADAPQYSISGPESGAWNTQAGPWTWNYLINDNINTPATNWYMRYAQNINAIATGTTVGPIFTQAASSHGPYTWNWTPTQSGLYYMYVYGFSQQECWNGPHPVSGRSLAQFTFLSY